MNINTIIIDGNNCKSKQDLFNSFNTALDFPDYFGHNWDSFEEIINDLGFLQHTIILISSYKSLLTENKEDKKIFSEIIKNSNLENDYKFYKIMAID